MSSQACAADGMQSRVGYSKRSQGQDTRKRQPNIAMLFRTSDKDKTDPGRNSSNGPPNCCPVKQLPGLLIDQLRSVAVALSNPAHLQTDTGLYEVRHIVNGVQSGEEGVQTSRVMSGGPARGSKSSCGVGFGPPPHTPPYRPSLAPGQSPNAPPLLGRRCPGTQNVSLSLLLPPLCEHGCSLPAPPPSAAAPSQPPSAAAILVHMQRSATAHDAHATNCN